MSGTPSSVVVAGPAARRPLVPPPLVGDRDHREGQQDQQRLVDVLAQGRERAAEEVAHQRDAGDPQHGADRAPGEEPAALHERDAGDHRDVGADERDEPPDDQRLVAVLVEERLGLVEVLALEDPAVPLVQRWPDGSADLVARDVAQERGRREQDQGDQQLEDVAAGEDVDPPGRDEQAHREQQGVTGEEREEQAALDEDDHQAQPEELAAELVEQPVGVHPVHAQNEWMEIQQHAHGQTLTGGTNGFRWIPRSPEDAVRRRGRRAGVACGP